MRYATRTRLLMYGTALACIVFLLLTAPGCGVIRGCGRALEAVGQGIAEDAEGVQRAMAQDAMRD